MTYHTPDLAAATEEMFRRGNKWGGTWVVIPHPERKGEYGVCLKFLSAAEPVKEYAGATLEDLIKGGRI